ncbi:HNH endonuclease signature motif containing protein [Microbacterium panaciterrae]|uniref:HNH nuclease domain-containing protein n=1 Tax=Microbacterium panaciterrae TaxID=985759 RepID=A0ABP8PE97_9MICO
MELFTEIDAQVQNLRAMVGDALDPAELRATVGALTDDEVVSALRACSAVVRSMERIRVVASGVAATRSTRSAGQSGLAQSRGHRNAAALLQEITGCTKAEAARQVRVGESLFADAPRDEQNGEPSGPDDGPTGTDDARPDHDDASDDDALPPFEPWHAALDRALLGGALTPAQHDAIRQGLSDPPASDAAAGERERAEHEALLREFWALAADQLVAAAAHDTPEMLGAAARAIRDRLDPDGATRRFQERYARRSFRIWTTADGHRRGAIDFDDEGYAWAATIIANALRPRTGGPRFVDAEEKARAKELTEDTRTNDQLGYDLIMDLLRAGALADAATVFGTRQAGVRLVQVVDAHGTSSAVAHSEDGLVTFPSSVADQHRCDSGAVAVTVDARGNPLDVGREHRLFTPKQRLALAIRDGGCRWRGCDRPASYGEAHHIDEWHRDRGGTDIDRGILLCRFHHMQLHHGGWRITRHNKDDFVLHHRSGESWVLTTKLALAYAWAGVDPPPKRFRRAA